MPVKKNKKDVRNKIVELNRHQLGSISLSDITLIHTLNPSERQEYIRNAESIFNNPVFKNEIKALIQAQLEFIGQQALEFDQILVGRGTINGLSLLEERMQMYHNEFVESTKREEDFDPLEL